jgi:serine/threonine protein kinase
MPAPTTADEFLDLLRKSGLVEPAKLTAHLIARPAAGVGPGELSRQLQADGLLTPFQTGQLLKGKYRGFFLGKYKLLDRIGMGGMGQVFLAEHGAMRRRVAVKVLPPDRAENQFSKERFLREARAVGQLDHPNLVRAFDVDADGDVIFLVMEFVDGVTFHDLVSRFGPLTPHRAAHYLMQTARGLDYLHGLGLVHRDVKPANLLVDRQGVVKLLDLGLVRSEAEGNELTKAEGVKILGTADYLAPEQAVDCSTVDVRADLYALGATGFFLLTGKPPFDCEKVASKLIAHQTKPPTPAHELNPAVPPELSAVLDKLMAKKPADRYQTPAELIAALAPWTQTAPALPTEAEIPSTAGLGGCASSGVNLGSRLVGGKAGGSGNQSTGGSNIKYHSDQPSAGMLKPGSGLGSTPVIRPVQTPVSGGPPKLTAAQAYAPPAPVAPAAIPVPAALPRPAVAAVPLVEPARPVPAPSRGRQRVSVAVGFALVLAVGAWNVARLTGATKPAEKPAAQARR